MPAPIDPALKEAVKASVITHGVRPTAAAFGLPLATVGTWSADEGWVKPKQLPETMQPSNGSNAPSVAAASLMEGYSGKTRVKLAKAAYKGSTELSKAKGAAIVAQAQQLKCLVDSADKLHGWSKSQEQNSLVSISFVQPSGDQAPIIDIQADRL